MVSADNTQVSAVRCRRFARWKEEVGAHSPITKYKQMLWVSFGFPRGWVVKHGKRFIGTGGATRKRTSEAHAIPALAIIYIIHTPLHSVEFTPIACPRWNAVVPDMATATFRHRIGDCHIAA